MATGRPVGEPFAAHRDAVSCVALCVSPSGTWPGLLIASGSDDSTVQHTELGRPSHGGLVFWYALMVLGRRTHEYVRSVRFL
jgi:hypothetical protein